MECIRQELLLIKNMPVQGTGNGKKERDAVREHIIAEEVQDATHDVSGMNQEHRACSFNYF